MKVKTLMSAVKRAKTSEDVEKILAQVIENLERNNYLHCLRVHNQDSFLTDDEAYATAQFSRVLSGKYIIAISLLIQNGAFTVSVQSNRMLDGLGFNSKSWEPISDLDDEITPNENTTLAAVAREAVSIALKHHQTQHCFAGKRAPIPKHGFIYRNPFRSGSHGIQRP